MGMYVVWLSPAGCGGFTGTRDVAWLSGLHLRHPSSLLHFGLYSVTVMKLGCRTRDARHLFGARFRNIEGSVQCLLSAGADETVEDFILICRVLEPIRHSVIDTIDSICTKLYGVSFFSFNARDRLQVIMDSSKVHET